MRYSGTDINRLVTDFCSGDRRAGEDLLKAFAPYLQKYYRLLRYGSWTRKDEEIRCFLTSFMFRTEDYTCDFLCKVLSRFEDDDLHQELAVVLLGTAVRFGFITRYFPQGLKIRLWEIIKDPILRTVPYDISIRVCQRTRDDHLDESWVIGEHTGDHFRELTPIQRLILKLKYEDGLTDSEVARKFTGFGRASVRKLREEAEAIVAESLRRSKRLKRGEHGSLR